MKSRREAAYGGPGYGHRKIQNNGKNMSEQTPINYVVTYRPLGRLIKSFLLCRPRVPTPYFPAPVYVGDFFCQPFGENMLSKDIALPQTRSAYLDFDIYSTHIVLYYSICCKIVLQAQNHNSP